MDGGRRLLALLLGFVEVVKPRTWSWTKEMSSVNKSKCGSPTSIGERQLFLSLVRQAANSVFA
jgi:hypothetical protein